MGILKRSAVLCVAAFFCWLVAPSTVDAKKKDSAGGNRLRRAPDHTSKTTADLAAGPSVTMTGISTEQYQGYDPQWPGSGTDEDPFIVTFHPHEEHLPMYMWKNDAMLNFHGTINDPDDQIQMVCLSLIEMPEEANQSYGTRDYLADMNCGVAGGDGNRVLTTEGEFECSRCVTLDFIRPVPGDYVAEWGLRFAADQDEIVPTGETVHFRIPELELTVTGIETYTQGSGGNSEGISWPGAGTADDPFIATFDTDYTEGESCQLNLIGSIYDPINRVHSVGLHAIEKPEAIQNTGFPFYVASSGYPNMNRPSQDEFLSDKGCSVSNFVPGDYVVEVHVAPIYKLSARESTGQILHIRVPSELQQEETTESVQEEATESVRKKSTPPKRGRLRDRN